MVLTRSGTEQYGLIRNLHRKTEGTNTGDHAKGPVLAGNPWPPGHASATSNSLISAAPSSRADSHRTLHWPSLLPGTPKAACRIPLRQSRKTRPTGTHQPRETVSAPGHVPKRVCVSSFLKASVAAVTGAVDNPDRILYLFPKSSLKFLEIGAPHSPLGSTGFRNSPIDKVTLKFHRKPWCHHPGLPPRIINTPSRSIFDKNSSPSQVHVQKHSFIRTVQPLLHSTGTGDRTATTS